MKKCQNCKYYKNPIESKKFKICPTRLDWICYYCDGQKSMFEPKEVIERV